MGDSFGETCRDGQGDSRGSRISPHNGPLLQVHKLSIFTADERTSPTKAIPNACPQVPIRVPVIFDQAGAIQGAGDLALGCAGGGPVDRLEDVPMQAGRSGVPGAALRRQTTGFESELLQELSSRLQSPLCIGICGYLKCEPILRSNILGNVDSPLPPSRIGNEIGALLVANPVMCRSKGAQIKRPGTAGARCRRSNETQRRRRIRLPIRIDLARVEARINQERATPNRDQSLGVDPSRVRASPPGSPDCASSTPTRATDRRVRGCGDSYHDSASQRFLSPRHALRATRR
jgi:hypothetical protein